MSKEIKISNEIEILTGVNSKWIESLLAKIGLIICNGVFEASTQDDIAIFDLQIGKLKIQKQDCGVVYQFVPTKKFQSNIEASIDGEDILLKTAESSLKKNILKSYKEIF